MKYFKLVLLILAINLTGCGSDSSSDIPTEPIEEIIGGGEASSPTELSITLKNEILNNISFNYFKYTGKKGEKLIIHSSLIVPSMNDIERARCNSMGSEVTGVLAVDAGIIVYDEEFNAVDAACGDDLTFTYPNDGTYIFYFNYSRYGNSGYFNASYVVPGAISNEGTASTPSNPSLINLDLNNEIKNNTFFNYFKYTGKKGEKLIIHSSLIVPSMNDIERARCNSMGSEVTGVLAVDAGIIVYDEEFNAVDAACGDDLTFTYPNDGTYIFYFNYSRYDNSGYFNASFVIF